MRREDDYFGKTNAMGLRMQDMYGSVDKALQPYIDAGDYKDAFAQALKSNQFDALTRQNNLRQLIKSPLSSQQMSDFYTAFMPYEKQLAGHESGYYLNAPGKYQGQPLKWGTNLNNAQDVQQAVKWNMENPLYQGIPDPSQVLGDHPRVDPTLVQALENVGQYVVLPAVTAAAGAGAFAGLGSAGNAAVGAGVGAANSAANGGNPLLGAVAGGVGASAPMVSEATGMNPALANLATRTAAGGISGGAQGAEAAGLGGALGYGLTSSGMPSYLGNAAGSALSSYLRGSSPEQAGITGLQRGASGYFNSLNQQQHAQGGPVKQSSLHEILNGPSFSQRAETPHFDDGGYVDYFTPNYPSAYDVNLDSPPAPDFSGMVLDQNSPGMDPYKGASLGDIIGWDNVVPTDNSGNVNLPSLGGSYSGPGGQQSSHSGLGSIGSALSGLLSNPNLLGALLGGGLGLAGAAGSKNGQETMLANYKPTPPPMFQGSGPSASNMYGNFSATPRQRLNPTNIDYAHAGEQPTPGGNMFFSPSGGPPTAPPSQTSPLQQYGGQPQPPAQIPLQQTSPSVDQLIALLGGQPTMHPMPIMRGRAEGGAIQEHGPLAASQNPHMVPATKGGPSYIQGPGTGQSDDIDAKLSNGEYVMDAHTVSMLGDGSNEAGAKKLDQLRERLRMHAAQSMAKGKQFMKAKSPQTYLKGGQS